jgi:hypothetical protein
MPAGRFLAPFAAEDRAKAQSDAPDPARCHHMPNRMEGAASGILGAIKSTKATFEGLTGVFKDLAREHGEVAALLLRVRATSDPAVRRALFPKIREELLSHEEGERAEVYSVFREHEELAGYAEMHARDTAAFERMIDGLSHLDYADSTWGAAFVELTNAVVREAKEEEDEYFPAASRILGAQASEALATRYFAAKQAAARGSDGT